MTSRQGCWFWSTSQQQDESVHIIPKSKLAALYSCYGEKRADCSTLGSSTHSSDYDDHSIQLTSMCYTEEPYQMSQATCYHSQCSVRSLMSSKAGYPGDSLLTNISSTSRDQDTDYCQQLNFDTSLDCSTTTTWSTADEPDTTDLSMAVLPGDKVSRHLCVSDMNCTSPHRNGQHRSHRSTCSRSRSVVSGVFGVSIDKSQSSCDSDCVPFGDKLSKYQCVSDMGYISSPYVYGESDTTLDRVSDRKRRHRSHRSSRSRSVVSSASSSMWYITDDSDNSDSSMVVPSCGKLVRNLGMSDMNYISSPQVNSVQDTTLDRVSHKNCRHPTLSSSRSRSVTSSGSSEKWQSLCASDSPLRKSISKKIKTTGRSIHRFGADSMHLETLAILWTLRNLVDYEYSPCAVSILWNLNITYI